jgi:hypothetical protein
MAIRYNGNITGTVTIAQQRKDEDKPRKYKIQIRQGNCLAVFLNVYKEENPEDPKKCWVHQLMNFLGDEQHLKNIVKDWKENVFARMLSANWIDKVELNLFYKESNTLLKYMVRDGLKVKCYYKEDKK